MTRHFFLAAFIGGVLPFTGCTSEERPLSSVSDVANPGLPGDANELFWMEVDEIVTAECIADRVPTRVNCTINPRRAVKSDVTQQALAAAVSELSAADTAVAQQITILKDADPTVISLKGEIQLLTTQSMDLTRAIQEYDLELIRLAEEKASLDERIAYDDEQLDAVAEALEANPNDANLLALQRALREERAELASSLVDVTADQESLMARHDFDTSMVNAAAARLTHVQAELERVYEELQVDSVTLRTLKAKQDVAAAASEGIVPVIDMIQSESVTYRRNLLSQGMQESLRLISAAIRPALVLTPGRYEQFSGAGNYCPQRAVPEMRNGILYSVTLTYLSPCSGVTHVYLCNGMTCSNSTYRMNVIDATRYSFNSGSGLGQFRFVRAELDAESVENGPMTDH